MSKYAEDATTSPALEALVGEVYDQADEDLTPAALTGRVVTRTVALGDLEEVYRAAQVLTTGEGDAEGGEAA